MIAWSLVNLYIQQLSPFQTKISYLKEMAVTDCKWLPCYGEEENSVSLLEDRETVLFWNAQSAGFDGQEV